MTPTDIPFPAGTGAGTALRRDPAQTQQLPAHALTMREADKSNTEKIIFMSCGLDGDKEGEERAAKPIGLSVELGGVPVGLALVDSGASRSIMRESTYHKIKHTHALKKVRNMYLLSATGHRLPIIGAVSTDLTSSGVLIARAMVYVVDTSKGDIPCDVIIGRSTLANSRCPHIDCTPPGGICSRDGELRLDCVVAVFASDGHGVSQLVPESTHAPTPRVPVNAAGLGEAARLSNAASKRRENELEQQRVDLEQRDKMCRLARLVGRKHYLTVDQQEQLLTYLVTASTCFIVPTRDEQQHIQEKKRTEELLMMSAELVQVAPLFHRLDSAPAGSVEEKEVVAELLASTFVPPAVKQGTHNKNIKVEQAETEEEKEIMKNVEDIDFPFTAPPQATDTAEYRAEKQQALASMVHGLTHLTPAQQGKLLTLLSSFADRFSLKGENMGHTAAAQHEIETTAPPFRERVRPYSPAVQNIIDAEVVKMLQQGVLVPSRSPYASNLLLVRKPDPSSEEGVKNRVCASFVRLNKQTVKDSYPLARISYIFDRVGNSKWFSTMDLLSGFWQVMIKPEHRHKTAVITMRGLYEFMVMPFGLCNAPATFQRLMDNIILPEYRGFIETYIDDLLTHSDSFSDHLSHLAVLLTALRKHNLMVKLSKCKFAQLSVKFLGHIISQGKLAANPQAVEAVKKWQRPAGTGKQAVRAVQSFLGMMQWFSKFIPHFADRALPLYKLTHKDAKFDWTPACQRAFEQLRDALVSAPVLAIADPNKPYVMHTDASDDAMGAVLMQHDSNNDLHPIAFASKTFIPAERNYDTTEREALAIVWGLEHFNTYCEGHKYTIITDHQALAFIRNNVNSSKRIHRWQLKLQPFYLDIQFKPGKDNHAADLLTRDRKLMEMAAALSVQPAVAHAYPVVTRQQQRQQQQQQQASSSAAPAARPPLHVVFPADPVTQVTRVPMQGRGRRTPRAGNTRATTENTERAVIIERANAALRQHPGAYTFSQPAHAPPRTATSEDTTLTQRRRRATREEFEVEAVVGKRHVRGRDNEFEYKVKWKGYPESDCTWEPFAHLAANAKDAVLQYERTQQQHQPLRQGARRLAEPEDTEEKSEEDELQEALRLSRQPPAAVQQEAGHRCTQCSESFYNLSQKLVHEYQQHATPPPPIAQDVAVVNDPALYAILQDRDAQLGPLKQHTQGRRTEERLPTQLRRELLHHVFVVTAEDLLYCVDLPSIRSKLRSKTQLRLAVPATERKKVMALVHGSVLSAHPGIVTMYDKMRETMWWPGMLRDIVSAVSSCDLCQHSKGGRRHVLPRPMSIPLGPWTHVAIDHVGPLPTTANGNKYVLVMMCRLSKCAECAAVPDTGTVTTVHALITRVVCRHGLMNFILSDRAAGFCSELIRQVYKRLGIQYTTTTAYHPQANGGVEVFNKVLERLGKMWCNEQQTDWDGMLPFLEFAYHTSFHTGLQEQPFFVGAGRYARMLPSDEFASPPVMDVHAYADEVANTIESTTRRIRELLASVNEEREADIQAAAAEERSFRVGDKVLLYNPATPLRHAAKLVKRWTGPHLIMARHGDVNYDLQVGDNVKQVHIHRLRKYEDADARNQYEQGITHAQDELLAVREYQRQLLQREQQLRTSEQQQSALRQVQEMDESRERGEQLVNEAALSVAVHQQEVAYSLEPAAYLPWR